MPGWVVPRSWRPLRSWEEVLRWQQHPGFVVILDTPTVSHFHTLQCPHVRQHHFETKRANGWKTGAYYWIPSRDAAAGYASPCKECSP
jgi:hypothetical protein